MNLMINIIESMRSVERDRGLTLSSQRDGWDQVRISISHNNMGLPAEGDLILNAFFTTKAHGTSLRVAISRSIFGAHGSRLWATANPGCGAAFHFTLPTTLEAYA